LLTFCTIPHAAHSAPIFSARSLSHPLQFGIPEPAPASFCTSGGNGNEAEPASTSKLITKNDAQHFQALLLGRPRRLKRSVDQEKAEECHATALGSRCTAGADNEHCSRYEQVRSFPTGHFDQPRGW
jgi:hypothetical protein